MTIEDARKMIALLKLHAPNHPTPPELADYWAITLDDVPGPLVMDAVRHWCKHHKWFPQPVELLDIICDRLGIPQPGEAWNQVQHYIRNSYPGVKAGPELPALVIEALREIGGAGSVRQSQNIAQTQQRFESVYAQMRRDRLDTIDYAAEYAALTGNAGPELHAIGKGAADD